MTFVPFSEQDFALMKSVQKDSIPSQLEVKIDELRQDLDQYPEFQLDFFSKRIVRRPTMRGHNGLVFGPPRGEVEHWYLYVVGGDQDQVQLNIGMWPDYLRVGLGFQIGRMVNPKIPAFHVFQTFLGVRPPLPFRDAFYRCVERNVFEVEIKGQRRPMGDADAVLHRLETFVVPADDPPTFVLVGALWDVAQAATKGTREFHEVFHELMPLYEELLLASGRYGFHL